MGKLQGTPPQFQRSPHLLLGASLIGAALTNQAAEEEPPQLIRAEEHHEAQKVKHVPCKEEPTFAPNPEPLI